MNLTDWSMSSFELSRVFTLGISARIPSDVAKVLESSLVEASARHDLTLDIPDGTWYRASLP